MQVSAHWAITEGAASGVTSGAPVEQPLRRAGLGMLLAATARRYPERLALIDPADKRAWSGRPSITWTYGAAAEIVERLARALRMWRLPPCSRIGLCLPGGGESVLALLAVEAAGHVPCLLPVAWDEERLLAAAQSAALSAVLTQARLGAAAPAERMCSVAARYFGLRYLAAFGPGVPDGVINLDRIVLERRAPDAAPALAPSAGPLDAALPAGGCITFEGGDPDRPMFRAGDALVAAAAAHLVTVRVAPAERILSLVGGHDLRGLVTGLGAALVSGATLETLPVFDGAAFVAALSRATPTHLVAPGFLERNLAGRDVPPTLRSICFVHRAPAGFSGRTGSCTLHHDRVADALAFDETAVLTGLRGGSADVSAILARPERLGLPPGLLAMRREADGGVAFRGQAAAASPLHRGIPATPAADAWRATPYAAEPVAGAAFPPSVEVAALAHAIA